MADGLEGTVDAHGIGVDVGPGAQRGVGIAVWGVRQGEEVETDVAAQHQQARVALKQSESLLEPTKVGGVEVVVLEDQQEAAALMPRDLQGEAVVGHLVAVVGGDHQMIGAAEQALGDGDGAIGAAIGEHQHVTQVAGQKGLERAAQQKVFVERL